MTGILIYIISFRNTKNITPGIPKKPAISAVYILIPMEKLKYPPMKLTINSKTAPKIPLITSFHNILRGNDKNLPMKNKTITAIKKVNITSGPIISPLRYLYSGYDNICR
jgi:hypothetical protein